jgi:hypothetical protein
VSERRVFKFTVDGEDRYADPYALHREFVRALDGDPGWVFEQAKVRLTETQEMDGEGRPVKKEMPADRMTRLDAEEELARAVRKALGLPAFDTATGEGVTDLEALDVLRQWTAFDRGNLRPAASSATCSRPAATSSAAP